MALPAVDLLFDPFGARWANLRDAALAAEEAGFDGVWTYDHLSGSVHGASHVLECWTVLSALAEATSHVRLGPMVLNVANRRPGVLAQMAATLQEVAGGRLLLGIGAGGGGALPYPREQAALGLEVPTDAVRRAQVRETVDVLRHLWSGAEGPLRGEHHRVVETAGFLRPDPPPPIVLGGFGPRMAALAGEVADGINAPHARLGELLGIARAARTAAGRDPEDFLVTTGAPFTEQAVSRAQLERAAAAGVHRLVITVGAPYDLGAIARVGARLADART